MLLTTFNIAKTRANAERNNHSVSTHNLLTRGCVTTITNPKVLLFFISFFPQFVAVEGQHHAASFFILGIAYAMVGFMTDVTFAIVAGGAVSKVTKSVTLQKLLYRLVGTTFIGLGIRLALSRR